MWELDSNRPIYLQIAEKIELEICSGVYQPGDKIPSVRELAQEVGVNPNTMQRALAELERKQIIVTFRTSGRTVTEEKGRIQAPARRQGGHLCLRPHGIRLFPYRQCPALHRV